MYAYDKGLINTFELPQNEIIQAIQMKYYQYSECEHFTKIDDTVKEMEWWACFKKE